MAYHQPFNIDRNGGVINFNYEYFIPAYIDPETYEYFDQTYWSLTLTHIGVSSYTMFDYASESASMWMDIPLLGGDGINRYTLDFSAFNTFSAVSVAASWNIIASAHASDPLVLVGGANYDMIIGGTADDVLRGNGGDDVLDGGEGTDILEGGAGADRLDGGLGEDVLVGGAGNDTYFVDHPDDLVIETPTGGVDSVISTSDYILSANVENLTLEGDLDTKATGNALANIITGNIGHNVLKGGDGDDTLLGGEGHDALLGEAGNDRLYGGIGVDRLEGGDGDDTYVVDSLTDIIVEQEGIYAGIDTVEAAANVVWYRLNNNVEILRTMGTGPFQGVGNGWNNYIVGGIGNDLLQGMQGDDALDGGLGDDRLEGGTGADELRGGAGTDTAIYTSSTSGIDVNLGRNMQYNGDAHGDRLLGIEDVAGSAFDDVITGNLTNNWFRGGAGRDTLSGGAGSDRLEGGAGADDLNGGADRDQLMYNGSVQGVNVNLATGAASGGDAEGDVFSNFENLSGGSGADTLTGDDGANFIYGNGGDDIIDGGAGDDVILGGAGADWIDGGTGNNRISYGGSTGGAVTVDLYRVTFSGGDAEGDRGFSFDSVEGGRGDDHLWGHDGVNTLLGDLGNDDLQGRGGDDILRGDGGADTLDGGTGNDTATYSTSVQGVWIDLGGGTGMYGDAMGDTFISIENIDGSGANDTIRGDGGANRLRGMAGQDFLAGGAGNDTLTGGAQRDTFGFNYDYDRDVVTDFVRGEDRIFIDFDGNISSFAQVMSVASSTGTGGIHTKFDFGNGDVLTINNVKLADFTADDFLFFT